MDDAAADPLVMPLDLLREITNDFAEERKLGSGSFGKVYKGVYQDGKKIAVKMLYDMPGLDDVQFQNEFKHLTRLQHQNIVRLVGYCHNIQEVQVKYEGKLVLAEKTHRALCLEYVSNGSLDKYLSDGCDRYDWHTCYGIINGICQGLKYLHSELEPPIYHLDLKPANVLLDENMVPRIADFGMSRLFTDEQTRATRSSLGTFGYLPPEYIHNNLISKKFDIFSLGVVIIKIMAGRAGYFNSAELSSQEFTDLVQENWTNRLLLETANLRRAYSEQVKICIEIGLSCVQEDRHKRPTIQDIVNRLNASVAKCTYAARKDLLIYQDSLGDITQAGNISNPNSQQETPSANKSSALLEIYRNNFLQYAQDSNDRHADQIYNGSTLNPYAQFIFRILLVIGPSSRTCHSHRKMLGSVSCLELLFRDIVATTLSICFGENAGPTEAILDGDSTNDNQEYSADGDSLPGIVGFQIVGDPSPGDSLPGIEGFQIIGDPRPGSTLRACGFPVNGTTLCNFQWVRWLEHGTGQSIEGATIYDYVVTADDVGALLAVDCTPMDDNGRQGDLTREFANNEKKITCDQEMQNDINICISRGRADFEVFVLGNSPEELELVTLVLRPTGYQINFSHEDVVIAGKYSPKLQLKISNGRTTKFVLVSSRGIYLPLTTEGLSKPNSEVNDVRLRDLIVLVMRTFQNKVKQEIPL